MRVLFQADADLNHTIVLATVRREPGIDFRSAVQADLEGVKDLEVLALAANTGRLLITHDIKTMPGHFAEFIQTATSPGVLLIPQHLPIATAVEEIILLWSVTDPEEWVNRIARLPL